MEDSHGSANTSTGLEDHEAPAPLDAGRLGGVLCQLQRARFDGVLHIDSGPQTASIGLRAGTPVTFDDPTPGHTLGQQLVERGQLTQAQCNAVIGRMTDAIVEDEAVAFFEHAVQLGFLTEEAATVELSTRIRARMIQLFALRDCRLSLEPGEAALFERREFPQDLGAIVYMGVRTFYEEEFLASCHPDLTQTYVQLLAAPATIAHFFGLDDEEFQLLRRLNPEQPVVQLLSDRRVDRVHLLGLLLLLRIAHFCEVSNQPLSRRPSFGSVAKPVSLPPQVQPTSASDAFSLFQPVQPPEPSAPPDPPAPRPAQATVDATQEALLEAAARTARLRRPSGPARRTSKRAEPGRAASGEGSVVTHSPAGATPQSAADAAPAASATPAQAAPHAVRPDYAKAHLKELIARRKQAAAAPDPAAAAGGGRDATRELREARGLLHAQQYTRAERILAGLVELDPKNDTFRAYHLWSRWRMQPEAAENIADELHDLAKKLMSEGEHAGFAAYILGHVYFYRKRDDLAERFFKRAHMVDRSNKDAERHLLILERRKSAAADGGTGSKKIFGIQITSSKPKA